MLMKKVPHHTKHYKGNTQKNLFVLHSCVGLLSSCISCIMLANFANQRSNVLGIKPFVIP
jgi:hypothetical protein